MGGAGDTVERRAVAELRVASGRKLAGLAVRYGVETRIGTFVEKVARGAFDASLASGRDVLALVDHDPKALLARTRSGTLALRSEAEGLAFEVQVPDTSVGRDIITLAERGDLGGMSFGFTVAEDGERWAGNVRELRAVELHEISVVSAWPAYDGTHVAARARGGGEARRSLALWRLYLETL